MFQGILAVILCELVNVKVNDCIVPNTRYVLFWYTGRGSGVFRRPFSDQINSFANYQNAKYLASKLFLIFALSFRALQLVNHKNDLFPLVKSIENDTIN